MKNLPIKVCGTCTIDLKFTKVPYQYFATKFKVIEDKEPLLILGIDFMLQNYVTVDFSRYQITIDGKTLPMEGSTLTELSSLDQDLLDKNRIFNINTITNKLVKQYFPEDDKLGKIKGIKHQIILNSPIPTFAKPYRLTEKITEELKSEIQEMEEKGLIQKSSSMYSSPAFVILKRNKKLRLIVDYRKLNSITISEAYPFPSVEEQLCGLKGSKVFSQIDLNQGYYQVEVDQKDRHKTSFVLPFGQYEFKVMPFGLKNSPRTFQRAMGNILNHLPYVKVFLDDILVYSRTINEHEQHLEEVLKLLSQSGATINKEKSRFFQNEVEYLGYVLNEKGIHPCNRNLVKLENFRRPTNVTQCRKLLRLINFLRTFIPNLSAKIYPITQLLKGKEGKKDKVVWKPSMSKIVDDLAKYLNTAPTLHHPNYDKNFTLEIDASNEAVGGALYQEKINWCF